MKYRITKINDKTTITVDFPLQAQPGDIIEVNSAVDLLNKKPTIFDDIDFWRALALSLLVFMALVFGAYFMSGGTV